MSLSRCAWSLHVVSQALGLIRCDLIHLIVAARKFTVPTLQDSYDRVTLFTFKNLAFFHHDRPPFRL